MKGWFRFVVVGGIIFGIYLLYLHYQITSKFEFHRWNLPSRVYSDTTPLYPGLRIKAATIKEKLKQLGYRPISGTPQTEGQFRHDGGRFEIYLHNFEYPHEVFEGYPISFVVSESGLQGLSRLDTGEPLTLTRLEPERIASIFDDDMEDRTFIPLDNIPEDLVQGVIAVEDARFYSHIGIDPIGIARAFVANIKAGRLVQGGSTLTQQLIKNFFLHPGRSFVRKFNEALMAILMELRYSKEEILEAYLNEIYLGQRGAASIAGVEEAAHYYFSKGVTQLSLAECALMAGLIRSPGYYSPYQHPKRAKQRRDFILKLLKKRELVLNEEYQAAIKAPLPRHREKRTPSSAPHFIEFVKRQLKENFPSSKLQSEGLKIFTTLDMHAQRTAEKAQRNWLDRLEKDYPFLKKKAAAGQKLEGAVIALQPQTGFVRAYVGGRDYRHTQFDHVFDAKRQPGSAFKPFVFLTAFDPARLDQPYTLASHLEDEPFTVRSGGKDWSPHNYDKKYHGLVSLRTVMEKSLNVTTSRLALEVGLDHIVYTAKQAGITSRLEPYPSLALGSFEVTPLELATAYTIFPNQGVRTQPISIRQVVTAEGEVLEKKEFKMKRLFSQDVIFLMNELLSGVIERGTGRSARSRGLIGSAAGKTGTTSDYRDAWFVGYTPDLLALSWVGYDDNSPTKLSGSSAALPIWTELMKTAAPQRTGRLFPASKEIIVMEVDKATGLLSKRGCGETIEEYFIEGTEPKRYCDESR